MNSISGMSREPTIGAAPNHGGGRERSAACLKPQRLRKFLGHGEAFPAACWLKRLLRVETTRALGVVSRCARERREKRRFLFSRLPAWSTL